jgi:hypothetical protein
MVAKISPIKVTSEIIIYTKYLNDQKTKAEGTKKEEMSRKKSVTNINIHVVITNIPIIKDAFAISKS